MAKIRTLTFVFIGLLLLFFGLSIFVKHKVGQKLEAGFADLDGASYDSYDVNFWKGKIAVSGISLDTETVQISEALNGNKITGTVDEAYINGLHWWDLLHSKHLLASEIALENPLLKIIKIPTDTIVKAKTPEVENTQAFFAQVKSIAIKNGEIAFFGNEKIENPQMSMGSISISFKDFTFNDALTENKMAIVDYKLSLENFYFQADDRLHDLTLEKITTEDKDLILSNFAFKSPFDNDTFFQKLEYRKSKFDIAIPEIILKDFNLEKVFQNKFELSILEINNPILSVFSDKNIPTLPNQQKELPTESLCKLKTLVAIDSIAVNHAKITYSLKEKEKQNRGEVFWTDVNATLENVTNDSLKIDADQDMIAKVNSKFMGSSNLDLTVRFFLDSPIFAYDVYGKLDTFDMRQTNQMFEDVTRIRVESGEVRELAFNFHADDNKSKGELDFYYNNLQVKLRQGKNKRPRKLLRWIVEKVIIKEKNTIAGSNKKGEIDILRNQEKGFFNQLWNSVLDGLKDVILPG